MANFVVGLTGGIGSGKTSVSDLFAARGILIADSDVISRQIVEPGQPAYKAIVDHFGNQVVAESGDLNRAKLREIVFADESERKFLEGQTHRRIMSTLIQMLEDSTSSYSMLVLSAGSGKSPLMNRMLVVDVSPEDQVKRVTSRDGNSEAQVRAIMAAQPTRDDRLKWADDVIQNSGSLDELAHNVENLHLAYLQKADANG